MEEVTVRVPDGFSDLIADEVIERGALRSLAKKRLEELRADKEEAEQHIAAFEAKYGTSFEEFEANLPDGAGKAVHEDYNEWYFWVETRRETTERIANVESIGTIE